MKEKILLIIPVYNESGGILGVIKNVELYLKK